jgi:hypothetical protein
MNLGQTIAACFQMPRLKLMLTTWATILGLIGHYSVLTVGQTITITGFFQAFEDVSVVAANPTATTVVGSRQLPHGSPNQTMTEFYIFGPSTAAYTVDILGQETVTTTCVLTRSLTTGSCSYVETVLVGPLPGAWETLSRPLQLQSDEWNYSAPMTVTAGLDKLSMVTAMTTSPAPSTSSALSTSSVISAIPPLTSNPAANGIAPSTTNQTMTTTSTPNPVSPTANRAATMHDIRYLRRAVLGLAAALMVAMLPHF